VANVKLNISPAKLVMVLGVVVPVGSVMLTRTVLRKLSVTLTVMLVLCVWLMLFGSAVRLMTSGTVMSNTVKLVVSVLLMFPLVSLAMMVTLYSPGGLVSVVGNVALKMSPARLVILSTTLLPSARVTLANTVSIGPLSVTFAVMLVFCVWLKNLGSAVTLNTPGVIASAPTKKTISVSFMLLEVSLAINLTV